MDTPSALHILASTNDTRGDLFTRLVKDLFFALGYDDLRLDVQKSGREIDIQGTHRLEPRRMVAECKAHTAKMGGADLNKFFGVLTRERDRHKSTPVAGYFVSLSGFRETGKEQELETSRQKRIILLDEKHVIQELVRARILVSHTEAVERAGHCAENAGLKTATLDGTELLGHEHGYLWTVFYSKGKERTHFALVHADGTPLSEAVAQEVINTDRKCKGSLHSLVYLAPPPTVPDSEEITKTALERYRGWVAEECGYIQLDGLPADADLSVFRMNLERLFVPLKLIADSGRPAEEKVEKGKKSVKEWTGSVGEFLDAHPRFSLLSKPGGGKSTLLKRLATVYATPERRGKVDDRLPDRDWLPLFLRCRELRDRAHRPIRELMNDLPQHAGMSGNEAAAFRDYIDEALRSGQSLLLVDGLDEISDEGARRTFAQHLRTFLAMFPRVATVVTSRDAGFRQVAGVVASVGEHVRLAPFDKNDVRRLCECWHVEFTGDNEKVRSDAQHLAETIWDNKRIQALAKNPLMLTTLLVVRRCIGELPNRRVELYWEAVRVLIRTWNTEGFEPMNLDETLARLSYVACEMMGAGEQRIGRKRLLKLLQKARQELTPELGFARVNETEFIDRIEYRSSLLIQTGHERIDGEIQPVYEFRHLTFQEYLAARGFVEEQYPGRDRGQSLVELLEPHFKDERWQEVVPLAAVLAGRKAEAVIKRLTTACELRKRETIYPQRVDTNDPRVLLLRQCLLDEVQITPATLRAALLQMARHGSESKARGSVVSLRRGKYGAVFQEVTEQAYFANRAGWDEYAAAMSNLALEDVYHDLQPHMSSEMADTLVHSLASGDHIQQTRAAFVCVWLAYLHPKRSFKHRDSLTERFRPLRNSLGKLLLPDDPPLALAAAWSLVWLGAARLPHTPPEPELILSLYRLWREARSSELARFAAWAFSTQPLLARDTFEDGAWGDCDAWLEQTVTKAQIGSQTGHASLVLAWYRRSPFKDSELAERLSKAKSFLSYFPTARDILVMLGEPGRRVLEAWDKSDK